MTESKLFFPKFEDIKVSTRTYTSSTNLIINIQKLYNLIEVVPYKVVPKKRGRKKKNEQIVVNNDVDFGSILTVKCEGKYKGVLLNPKKTVKIKKWFRNSITIVILFDKIINFKICKNGTFQMTGCKNVEHAKLCVKHIWEFIKDKPNVYEFKNNDSNLSTLFIPSMRNIDFSLNFLVDREKLNSYISNQEEFHCLLETSFGYTGVNIKIPIHKPITDMRIKKLIYNNEEWIEIDTTYEEYISLLTPKERDNKLNSTRYNTFLVFHSGKVIMSGLNSYFMEDTYYYFTDMINKCYEKIQEKLF